MDKYCNIVIAFLLGIIAYYFLFKKDLVEGVCIGPNDQNCGQYNDTQCADSEAINKGCSIQGLRQIVKKGQGAYYSSGSRPNQTAHSWGRARLASAITGGKSSQIDYHILKKSCKKGSKALRLADRSKYKKGIRRVAKT